MTPEQNRHRGLRGASQSISFEGLDARFKGPLIDLIGLS
jgi:hypothetical protein